MDLSVIVPLHDERPSLRPLHEALVAALDPLGSRYEILLVDDGSRDGTFESAREIAAGDPRVRVIRLRRNFGQTAAMAAGFDLARGRVLVTMDGDLQNDPRDIPALLGKIEEGFDVVCGRRIAREDALLSRRLPSFLANRLVSLVCGCRIHDNGCTLRAYRPESLRRIPLRAGMHRLLPAVAALSGSRVTEVEVRHHPRRFGRSKYGLSRIYGVLLDLLLLRLLLTFASRPLVWFGGAAALPGAAGFAGLAWWSFHRVTRPDEPSLMAAGSCSLLLALAAFLLAIGMVAELACGGEAAWRAAPSDAGAASDPAPRRAMARADR